MLQLISAILTWLAVVPAVLSVAVYSLIPWWRSAWGRNVMTYMSVLAALLVLGAIGTLLAPEQRAERLASLPNWYLITYMAAYMLLPVALWWRLALIVRDWNTARREGS